MGYRWLSGAIIILLGASGQGVAQSYPDCPPPASGEYLLLVRGADETTRDRTTSVLPVDKTTLVCNYLGNTVIRAGGFNSLEVANSWALYLNDIEQLETVVVEPSAANVATAPEPAAPEPTAALEPAVGLEDPVESPAAPAAEEPEQPPVAEEPTATPAPEPATEPATVAANDESGSAKYQPTLLGEGVAVLVDYQQNPDIGRDLAQQGTIGLAVYQQQPYLLVLHTTDSSAAAARLQELVDSGLTSFLVDGQQVIRLTDSIR